MRRPSRQSRLRVPSQSCGPAASVDLLHRHIVERARLEQASVDAHPLVRRIGQGYPVRQDTTVTTSQAGEIGRVGIGPDVAVQLAFDHQLIGRKIDALETGLAAQAAIAVRDLVGLVRHGDADTAAMTRADQRAH